MSITRQQQRDEAIALLEILIAKGLEPDVLNQFKDSSRVFYSERNTVFGVPVDALFWADNSTANSELGKPFNEVISSFEKEHGAFVYHATHERFSFGEILDLFYVSQYDDGWPRERDDLEGGYPFVCAINLSDGFISDFGVIGCRVVGGGLLRTA